MPNTFVDTQVVDGVATLSIHRPQAGNALNRALLEQLRGALGRVVADPEARAIVVAAAGNRFVSGADVGFFVRCLDRQDVPAIVDCIRASQEVFAAVADCPKPVVAAVQGAAVGGGVELALACHRIVTTPRASFSFPETSLGILPFSGGTYRTPRRIGAALTKWLIYAGHILAPPKAVKLGLVDQLVMPHELPAAATALARSLADSGSDWKPVAATIAPEFAALEALFGGVRAAELQRIELPADRIVAAAVRAVAARPLVALERSEALIDRALSVTANEGAAAALAVVPELFASAGVYEKLMEAARLQQEP